MNATRRKYRIKNLSVTLYAFHLRQDLADEVVEDADRLWSNLEKLSGKFSVPEQQKLTEKLLCYENGRYSPAREKGMQAYRIELIPGDRYLDFRSVSESEGFPFSGRVYPVRLHDTYAADFALLPDQEQEIDVSQLSQFNPGGCLLPGHIQASLGQTLFLYAKPADNAPADQSLADACVAGLLQGPDIPPCNGRGRLFGSPIFEYEDATYNPLERRHILVWLYAHHQTLELTYRAYHVQMNLLCCRNKILFAWHQSRESNENARQLYSKLEAQISRFSPSDTARLRTLLTEMPADELDYARHIRNLRDHSTAINANIRNYAGSLEKIRSLSLPESKDDLAFFDAFRDNARGQFLCQIRTDLSYLIPGQQLSQQLIQTIRGIVEIDTLNQLGENEKSSSKRQERLEIIVASIVVMLEMATISAAIDARIWGRVAIFILCCFIFFLSDCQREWGPESLCILFRNF